MSRNDSIELFQKAMMWSGSAFVLGAMFGFAIGLHLTKEPRP